MTRNLPEVSAKINAEDELIVASDRNAFEDSDNEDEKRTAAAAKKVGYDESIELGYQRSIAAAEFGLKQKHKIESTAGKTLNYVTAGIVYGELQDKLSVGLHVYLNGIVAHFQSDQSTDDRGYTVCPFFTAVGVYRDPATGDETLRIEFRDRFGAVRQVDVRRSLIAEGAKKLVPYLADNCFDVPQGPKLREYVVTLLQDLRPPRALRPTTTGWVRDSDRLIFATPKRLIGDVGDLRIVQTTPANVKIGKRGTYDDWRRDVGSWAKGNTRLGLALATALASPLLRFAPSITPSIIHLYGESSCGKTTAAALAGSVWGGSVSDPLGYGHSWNATANFLMSNASAHSGTLFSLDELGTGEGVERVAYGLANGQERGRLDKSANQRPGAKISVFTLSTGEQTFDEKLKSSSPRTTTFAGAEARLISIPADAGKGLGVFDRVTAAGPSVAAERIQEASRENYGHAGPMFIEKLIQFAAVLAKEADAEERQHQEDFGVDGQFEPTRHDYAMSAYLRSQIKEFVVGLNLDAKADAAVLRAARAFGLISTAGKLACKFDVLPLDEADIEAGVRTCFLAWIAERGGAISKTTSTALVGLRNFINSNEPRFTLIGASEVGHRPINPVGYKETSKSGNITYYILPSAWNEVTAAAPRGKLAEELVRLDLLIRPISSEGTRTYQTVKRIDPSTRVRVYAIDGAVRELTDHGTLEPDTERSPKKNVVDIRTRRAVGVLRGEEVA